MILSKYDFYLLGFVTIWERFQKRARTLIENIKNDAEHILWTSTLTSPDFIHRLPNDYTIQIWADETVSTIISKKLKMGKKIIELR